MKLQLFIMTALLAVRAHSATITLDFEAPLPGGLVAAIHSHLATAPASAIVSTQYSDLGVIFGGAVLLNLGSGHATSGTNGVGGLDALGRFNAGAPITLTFVSPTDGETPATTDFFSVYTDLLGGSDNGALISAYDIDGALLDTATYQEPGQNGSTPIVLSDIGQIHTVVVDATLNDMATGAGGIQFDLISYNTPVVAEPMVSITAIDPNASEPGSNIGKFKINRTGPTNAPLRVNYTVSGTASAGLDYSNLTSSVSIPAGKTNAVITVKPIDDTQAECPETVVATLVTSAAYVVGLPGRATVTITDNELPRVTITAPDPLASEAGPSTGLFKVTRSGCTNTPLTVGLIITGTAANGIDYQRIANAITIRAGAKSSFVVVRPRVDALVEGQETVILTLGSRSTYTNGSPNSATVRIANNDPSTISIRAQRQ